MLFGDAEAYAITSKLGIAQSRLLAATELYQISWLLRGGGGREANILPNVPAFHFLCSLYTVHNSPHRGVDVRRSCAIASLADMVPIENSGTIRKKFNTLAIK